jgi:hypothetical protein
MEKTAGNVPLFTHPYPGAMSGIRSYRSGWGEVGGDFGSWMVGIERSKDMVKSWIRVCAVRR